MGEPTAIVVRQRDMLIAFLTPTARGECKITPEQAQQILWEVRMIGGEALVGGES